MDSKKEQFSQVYDEYIGKIYRFVYLKVNSQDVAEDITSKVFLRGWEAYQNGKIDNIGAFLYKIAGNSVIDFYREKSKKSNVSTEIAPQLADNKADIHSNAVLSADVEMIKFAIQNIKKEYQDIIIWHYLDGMGTKEISEIMGKPVGTVRVMLHRGLKDLRKELKGKIQEA